MFSKKKKNLGGKLFILTIIALFIYGYLLNESNINYLKNLSSREGKKQVAEGNNSQANIDVEKNNRPVNSLSNNPDKENKKVISVETKLIYKTYDEESNDIITDEAKVPDEMVNLSIEDAKKYIHDHYSHWVINKINENYIEIYKTVETTTSQPYFLLQEEEGKIYIFEFDEAGNKKMLQETNIKFSFLSEVDQDYFREGIIKYNLEDMYEILQDFES